MNKNLIDHPLISIFFMTVKERFSITKRVL
ncbi:hypothetical protein PAAL109150_06675 [Paenibacillus alkaliterrae]